MKTQLHRVCLALAAGVFLAACDASINAPVEIEDGTKDASGRSTVNGSIHVGDDVTVTSGAFRSVNGSARIGSRSTVPSVTLVNGAVTVGADSTTGTLETVNGDITIGEGTRVTESIESVNGKVSLAPGAEVARSIRTVNGRITLDGATVQGDIENVNGGMSLTGQTLVNGDLAVRRPKGVDTSDTVPVVLIGPEVKIVGSLTFEREVDLQLHPDAEVGEIIGASPSRTPKGAGRDAGATAWYEGGNLHSASGAEWQSASSDNRLATAADIAAEAVEVKSLEELRPVARQLEECISEAVVGEASVALKVSEVAAACVILLGE